jgi:chromosomal replication initiator protein
MTLDQIVAVVCKRFGLRREQILSTDRHKSVALARHLVVYFARRMTDMSYPEIGIALGRDHGTIMKAEEKICGAAPGSRIAHRVAELEQEFAKP